MELGEGWLERVGEVGGVSQGTMERVNLGARVRMDELREGCIPRVMDGGR